MTKQQMYDGLSEQGLDSETMEAVKTMTSSMNDELSQENIKTVLTFLDEVSLTDSIIEKSLEDELDATQRAHSGVMDAAEEYLENVATQTIADIDSVKSMLSQE
jgi:hypothetical protein